ncbi:hypothetical protein IJT10_04615 [bacterium]|nr:hypothetical protein [bacterium]
MTDNLIELEEILGYRFKDKRLLELALTHESYTNEHSGDNNERLEFLGDSVVCYCVCRYLYEKYPNKKEGELVKIKSYVVSNSFVAQ